MSTLMCTAMIFIMDKDEEEKNIIHLKRRKKVRKNYLKSAQSFVLLFFCVVLCSVALLFITQKNQTQKNMAMMIDDTPSPTIFFYKHLTLFPSVL